MGWVSLGSITLETRVTRRVKRLKNIRHVGLRVWCSESLPEKKKVNKTPEPVQRMSY